MSINFADNLKSLRLEQNLTQSELAQKLGTTQRKISYWEAGTVEPDLKSLIDLAKFFKVSSDYLLGIENF